MTSGVLNRELNTVTSWRCIKCQRDKFCVAQFTFSHFLRFSVNDYCYSFVVTVFRCVLIVTHCIFPSLLLATEANENHCCGSNAMGICICHLYTLTSTASWVAHTSPEFTVSAITNLHHRTTP